MAADLTGDRWGSATRRGAWTIADQVASSATNFALVIVVIRSVDAEVFGGFSVAYLTFFVALMLARSLTSEPLLVRHSDSEPATVGEAIGQATGLAVVLGVALGLVEVVVGIVAGGPLGSSFVAFGLVTPVIALQDTLRFGFFASGKPSRAFWSDALWGGCVVVALVILFALGESSVRNFILAWGLGAAIAAVWAVAILRRAPSLGGSGRWLRLHADIAPRFAAELIIARGAGQIALVVVGAVASLAVLGAVNAARTLFAPAFVLFAGSLAFAVPEGIRLLNVSVGSFRRFVWSVAFALAGSVLVLSSILLIVPAAVGEFVFGELWNDGRALLVPMAIWAIAEGWRSALLAGLRSLVAAKSSLAARLWSAPIVLIGAVLGSLWETADGAAYGLALGHLAGVAFWWRAFNLASREAGPTPVGRE